MSSSRCYLRLVTQHSLFLLYHLNDFALFAGMCMRLYLDWADVGTDTTAFAMIIVKLDPTTILDDDGQIRAVDPAYHTVGALVHVVDGALNTPGTGIVLCRAARLEDEAGDVGFSPGSVLLGHICLSLFDFFIGPTQGLQVALDDFAAQLGPEFFLDKMQGIVHIHQAGGTDDCAEHEGGRNVSFDRL